MVSVGKILRKFAECNPVGTIQEGRKKILCSAREEKGWSAEGREGKIKRVLVDRSSANVAITGYVGGCRQIGRKDSRRSKSGYPT
jgi:hypothetical protein